MNSQCMLLFVFLGIVFRDEHLITFVVRLRRNDPNKNPFLHMLSSLNKTHEFSMIFTDFVFDSVFVKNTSFCFRTSATGRVVCVFLFYV